MNKEMLVANLQRMPRAARLTPRGAGGVAVIGIRDFQESLVEQLESYFKPASGKPWGQLPLMRPLYGEWDLEDVVVVKTCEHDFEIQCHGSDAAVARILGHLESCGCNIVSPWQLRREEISTYELECEQALSRATSLTAAKLLLKQQTNAQQTCKAIREAAAAGDWSTAGDIIDGAISWSRLGLHLTQPWQVVLCGAPNAGKSSLINRLLGYERAIVYDRPGTTRDRVSAFMMLEGWALEITDTAGIRTTNEDLEVQGIKLGLDSARAADCVILLTDVTTPPDAEETRLSALFADAIKVWHKVDQPIHRDRRCEENGLPVSSLTGAGIDELEQAIIRHLIPQEPTGHELIPFTSRQIQLLKQMNESVDRQRVSDFEILESEFFHGEIEVESI